MKFLITLLFSMALVSCAPIPLYSYATRTPSIIYKYSIIEIRDIIAVSNPKSPKYDPTSVDYAKFSDAINQLSLMGEDAINAAGDLALAIAFPRQESYLAAQALIILGTDITSTTIDLLYQNTNPKIVPNQKPDALVYSIILLASTGKKASCAIGNIGPLLFYPDPYVRTAAVFALDRINNSHLLESKYQIRILPSFISNSLPMDNPEGSISEKARYWWINSGVMINWHSSYGFCDP